MFVALSVITPPSIYLSLDPLGPWLLLRDQIHCGDKKGGAEGTSWYQCCTVRRVIERERSVCRICPNVLASLCFVRPRSRQFRRHVQIGRCLCRMQELTDYILAVAG